MNDKEKNKQSGTYDLMQDTQYLLLNLDETEAPTYALEDILAEFGGETPPAAEKPAQSSKEEPSESGELLPEESVTEHTLPVVDGLHPKIIAFPGIPAENDASCSDDTMVLIDMREYEEEEPSAQELFGLAPEPEQPEPVEKAAAEQRPERKPVTMEDIVASTVDAVIADQEKKQVRQRRSTEKKQKKLERKRPQPVAELPEEEPEQPAREAAAFHKRRWQQSRRALIPAVVVLALLWLPCLLDGAGVAVPWFSDSGKNAVIYILAAQVLLSVLCAGVFRAAVEEWKDRFCTAYTYTALTDLVVLLDTILLFVLPERADVMPLGGVAGVALVFSLWGLKGYHRGMWETFRTAGMGEPAGVADSCEYGIARGNGRSEGFVRRAKLESTASQWQRLLLPALTTASVVFALLSSVGQGNGQSFLWCWSAVLCASCSLVCPMVYCVPLGRIARRLSHNGTAVAGCCGAAVLAGESKVVVTDMDLFPNGSVSLVGIKLYGEERHHAISYTATLAIQGGGCLGRVFEEACQNEHISCQPLEHFHVHDDNGLSGMIRGETVLVGTPVFMRRRAVRMPSTLPTKTAVCLAVDGELLAVFGLKYTAASAVETALHALGRNRLKIVVATRDGNVTPKLIKKCFGADGKASLPEIGERLALSDPKREAAAPNGLLYRDGILPFVELVALSRRLCQMARVGNFLSILSSVFGALLGFYLTFVGRSDILSPGMLLIYLLLWTLPMLPLLAGADKM